VGKTIHVPLHFLSSGTNRSTIVRDQMDEAAAVKIEKPRINRGDSLVIRMRAGGGFVGKFEL